MNGKDFVGIDFDGLRKRYNRRYRLREIAVFWAVYAVLMLALLAWQPQIAAGLALPVLLAWAITRFIFR